MKYTGDMLSTSSAEECTLGYEDGPRARRPTQ